MMNNYENENYGGFESATYDNAYATPSANNISGVAKIKVIGVGGAGNNAVDRLIESGLKCAEYIVETGCTVRACSAHFSISKSTVHKDITERLFQINPTLAKCAGDVMSEHKQVRHIRGGLATKLKYAKLMHK